MQSKQTSMQRSNVLTRARCSALSLCAARRLVGKKDFLIDLNNPTLVRAASFMLLQHAAEYARIADVSPSRNRTSSSAPRTS
jgi:hypothetical protein